ncbi:hypothetical protein [Adlercreutzia equolifaciens]|uniref:hypothetical protein n=1 Tax=Adlercreutzia equolifaciens TaxID=446660 RepID=UPI003AB7D4A4
MIAVVNHPVMAWTCQRWYCGHWHINKHIDHIDFLFGDVEEFAAGLKPFDPNAPAKEHSF